MEELKKLKEHVNKITDHKSELIQYVNYRANALKEEENCKKKGSLQ
jgi:hypothetical protein